MVLGARNDSGTAWRRSSAVAATPPTLRCRRSPATRSSRATTPRRSPAAWSARRAPTRSPTTASGRSPRRAVTIGDNDFAGPGEPLAAALPNARLQALQAHRPLRHAGVVRVHRRGARVPRGRRRPDRVAPLDRGRKRSRSLRAGGLVAIPTETVYGLGADAANERAVRRIFEVKGRPAEPPADRARRRRPTELDAWATSTSRPAAAAAGGRLLARPAHRARAARRRVATWSPAAGRRSACGCRRIR